MKGGTKATLFVLAILAAGTGIASGAGPRETADALWSARGDMAKAAEAITAFEALKKGDPGDFEILHRLSRLHYWLAQNLEGADEKAAIAHYAAGREYGKQAAAAAPGRAGGYFMEAVNMARETSLKGVFKSLMSVGKVEELNRKASVIQPEYFHAGPDRFFCAYYTRLPGLLGGSAAKAIDHGRKAVAASPRYAGNRVFLAEAYVKDGKNDMARRELEAALALPDDAVPEDVPEQRFEKRRAAALLGRIGK